MDAVERTRLISSAVDTEAPARLWVLGDWTTFPVLRVPVAALVMNIDNRRFAAERRLFETQLGHALDPENSEADALSVEAILLDKDLQVDGDKVVGKAGKDYLALRQDWQRRKQESPFWIRPDGTVRNGNRRLAMLRRLDREEGAEGYEYVDAVVLDPTEINEIAMFEMEQREQLTEDYKVRYTDINLLLAIKDAAEDKEIDWFDDASIDRIAGSLQHVMRNNKSYALVQLYAIKYMDAFLDDMAQSDQYDKLIGQIERFREVGRAMRAVETDDPTRSPEMLEVCFAAVRSGLSHLEIRDIRRLFARDRDQFDQLVTEVRTAEGDWEPTPDEDSLSDPDVVDEEFDEDDGDDEPPGPVVTNYPRTEVQDVFDNVIDRHKASQSEDVLKTLNEVINRLQALAGPTTTKLADALLADENDEVEEALRTVVVWIDEHRTLLT